nr:hypothetical protein Iba_chr06dCG11120 [Ipomoea batatas]
MNQERGVEVGKDAYRERKFPSILMQYIDNVFGNVEESVEASLLTAAPATTNFAPTEEVMAYFNEADSAGEAAAVETVVAAYETVAPGDSDLQDIEGFAPTMEVVVYFNEANETASQIHPPLADKPKQTPNKM